MLRVWNQEFFLVLNSHLKKLVEGADSFAVRIIPWGPWNYRLVWCHLNLSPYQQQGWLASGHSNWPKIPGAPLAIPTPTPSRCLLRDSQDTLSLVTLKPVSAVNELLRSPKIILTFLKGTEKNKKKPHQKNLQLLTRSALKKKNPSLEMKSWLIL